MDRLVIKLNDLNIKLTNNYVLCKVDVIDGRNKSGLYVANSDWDESGVSTRSGTIVALPIRLFYRSNGKKVGAEWNTQIEAMVGDVAYWGIMAANDSPIVKVNGDVYFLIPYEEIRVVDRDGYLIPLNGFVLVDKFEDVIKSDILILDHLKKINKSKGKVVAVGTPNSEYYGNDMVDSGNINIGDVAIFSINAWTPLEDERFARQNKNLGYIQNRWIVGCL